MVTAILPSLTDESEADTGPGASPAKTGHNPRHSIAFSVESEATITPDRYTRTMSAERTAQGDTEPVDPSEKTTALAGYVGLFTGCGALVALALFLPLPARFSEIKGVTQSDAVSYSFYVVGAVSLVVAVCVLFGLRKLKGEKGKGWKLLLGIKRRDEHSRDVDVHGTDRPRGQVSRTHEQPRKHTGALTTLQKTLPYLHLLKDSVLLGFTDSRVGLGYLGGFVARSSTVAISLFIPVYVNTFFIDNGFCRGSPNDPSPELKKECRAAYVLTSIVTGVAQLLGLMCAPVFGYLSSRTRDVNYPIVVSSVFGIVGYLVLPHLASPEIKNVDGRGGSPAILVISALIGISQIGAIVCSLGSLGRGVLAVELVKNSPMEPSLAPDEDESTENDPLIQISVDKAAISRVQLKGSIAGVYSLLGGAGILLLTKLGGSLFDTLSHGAPFYMMAIFNGVFLVTSLLVDASHTFIQQ